MLAYPLVDLNPVWDQIIYTPVHSLKETLLLEVMDYQNLTKDRSLGTVELKVSDLAREIVKGAGDPRFSFESTGKINKSEPIRLDRGNQYKGQLHYFVEFLPAFALQDLKFDTGSKELPSTVEGVEDGDDVDDDSSSSKRQVSITTTEPIGAHNDSSKSPPPPGTTHAAASTEVSKTASTREGSPPTQVDGRDGVKPKNEGMRMSKDELLAHRRWHFALRVSLYEYRSQSPGLSFFTSSLASFPGRPAWRSSSMTVTGLPSAPRAPMVTARRGNMSVKAS